MRLSEALSTHRQTIREIVARHFARKARVFGSVARGGDSDNSDLDVLDDPLPGATLLDLGAKQVELGETLGLRIDLLTPSDLPTAFRDRVLREAVAV